MENSFVIGALIFFLVGAFFLQGLRRIEANPPHVALVTIFGERNARYKREGWRFFPIYPYWYGFVEINVFKVNQDLEEQIVRTPDRAELGIPISITWTPDYEGIPDPKNPEKFLKKGAEQLITFLNSRGETGVRTILQDIVRERLREWAFSNIEGPQNWQEAMGAQEEAVEVLLKAILGEALDLIPSAVPTPILMKYFSNPQKPLTETEQKKWGENWIKVTEKFQEEATKKGKTEEQYIEEIKEAVNKRQKDVAKARQGNGRFHLSQLGIVINRLNIDEIKLKGKLAEAAEFEVKEKQERIGEIFEIKTDVLKALQLVKHFKKMGEKIPISDAFRIIMEWKTTREGKGFTIPGIAPALADLAKIFLSKGGK